MVLYEPLVFPHRVFPIRVFPDRVFPGPSSTVVLYPPLVFPHRVFPIRVFPDRIFHGPTLQVVQPSTPFVSGGGRIVSSAIAGVSARFNTWWLAAIEYRHLRAAIEAAGIGYDWPIETFAPIDWVEFFAALTPAEVRLVEALFDMAPFEMSDSMEGTTERRPRKRWTRQHDEDELLEHYLASLAMMGKRDAD